MRQTNQTRRRVLLGAAAAVVIASGLGFAVTSRTESAAETPAQSRVLAVSTTSVRPISSYEMARQYTGAVVARRTTQLGAELAGRLEQILVDEGDAVTADMPVARLDTELLDTRRRQIEARHVQAKARLAEMIEGPRVEYIAAARAAVEALQAQVELLRLQRDRHERMLAQNASSSTLR